MKCEARLRRRRPQMKSRCLAAHSRLRTRGPRCLSVGLRLSVGLLRNTERQPETGGTCDG
jgi:hypothetical protein